MKCVFQLFIPAAPENVIILRDLLIGDEWKDVLKNELESDYIMEIETFLCSEYSQGKQIFPPRDQIFNIFNLIPPDQVSL